MSLTPSDRAAYSKIADELHVIALRLNSLSESGFSDMEGADMPEFSISEELHNLYDPAEKVAKCVLEIRKLMDE